VTGVLQGKNQGRGGLKRRKVGEKRETSLLSTKRAAGSPINKQGRWASVGTKKKKKKGALEERSLYHPTNSTKDISMKR